MGLALLSGLSGWLSAQETQAPEPLLGGALSEERHLVSAQREAGVDGSSWSPLHLPVNGVPHVWQSRPERARTDFTLGAVGEYNDNVTRAGSDKVADYLVTGLVEVDAALPLPGGLTLRMSGGLGAESYLDHAELVDDGDRIHFIATPGTELSLQADWEPVRLRLFDRFSLQHVPYTDFPLDQMEILSWMQNEAGADLQWQMGEDWTLDLGYTHTTMDSRNARVPESFDEESLFDRESNVIRATLAWSPSDTWSTGLEGSLGWHQGGSYQSDGQAGTLGLFLQTPLGKKAHLRLAAGVQRLEFDAPPEFERTVTREDLAEAEKAAGVVAWETVSAAEMRDAARNESAANQSNGTNGSSWNDVSQYTTHGSYYSSGATLIFNNGAYGNSGSSRRSGARSSGRAFQDPRPAILARIATLNAQLAAARAQGDAFVVAVLEAEIAALTAQLNDLPSYFPTTREVTGTDRRQVVEDRKRLAELRARRAAEDRVFASHHRDYSELTDFYAQVSLGQEIGSRFYHSLTLGHESALNVTSNFLTSDYVAWRGVMKAWKGAEFSLGLSYDWVEESGGHTLDSLEADGIADYVAFRQDYQQWSVTALYRQRITRWLRAGLGGQFSRLDAEAPGGSYDQVAGHAELVWTLAHNTELALVWRFTTAKAEQDRFDYEQNRAIISLRYRF